MIHIPYKHYYVVHASVLDKPGRFNLFVTRSNLDAPGSEPCLPDILVTVESGNSLNQVRFTGWGGKYWHQMEDRRGDQDFIWDRSLTLRDRSQMEKLGAHVVKAFEELAAADPMDYAPQRP